MIWNVLLLVVFLGGFAALLGPAQRMIVFPGSRQIIWEPSDAGWDFEDISLEVDGHLTQGWYIPVPEARGVVLFSHGNGGNLSGRMDSIAIWRDLGFTVLIYSYGGYANSTGKPSEQRCYKDIRAMWSWLTEEQGMPPENIVVFGRSLGGAVAADLAAEVTPGAVILESTFLSAVRLGREVFPFLPVGLLLRHRFETEDKIERFTAPLLVVHSPDDDIVPYHHGKALFEMAPEPKEFLEITGSHNEGFLLSGPIYVHGLRDFLEPLFPRQDTTG